MTRFSPTTLAVLGVAIAGLAAPSAWSTVIVTDTYSRDTSPTGLWGSVDNGSVGGETGTVAADYGLQVATNIFADGSFGVLSDSRVVVDYNLAADADVIAGGGFIVEWKVNPANGDVAGTGREFAGIGLSDSNQNPPYGGPGAITNGANDTLRYALLPRNSGSVGTLTRTAGNVRTLAAGGNPFSGFNEVVFDQPVFDDYVANAAPDPFVNDKFYTVRIEVAGDFSAASSVTVNTSIDGFALATETIEWGDAGQAYVSAIAFNGPHQYDDLKITALPEPASLALVALGGLAVLGRRH